MKRSKEAAHPALAGEKDFVAVQAVRASRPTRDGHVRGWTRAPGQGVESVIHRHGLTDIRLHDLRHTWATLALKAGVPVKVVQERSGRANPSTTMDIHAHALPGMQARAAEQVAALFGRSIPVAPPRRDPGNKKGPANRAFIGVRGGT